LPNKRLHILVLFFFALKLDAQFLDSKKYLVDSIQVANMDTVDKKILDGEIKKYNESSSDTTKIKILSGIVEALHDENVWIKYNRLLHKIATEKLAGTSGRTYFVFKSAQSLALNNYGYYYFNYSSDHSLALDYYMQGLKINEELNNYHDLVASYSNVGNVYQSRGNLNKSLEYYQKSLALVDKVNDNNMFMAPLNNLAQVYTYLNDTANALRTMSRAFEMNAGSEDKFGQGSLLHNIGILSYQSGKKPGLQAILQALELRKQIGDRKGIIQSNLSLAGIETKKHDIRSAEKRVEEASALMKDFKGTHLEALYYHMVANIKEATGKREEAIVNEEASVEIYKRIDQGVELSDALSALIFMYGDNPKYVARKLKAYEDFHNITSTIDKSKAQKMVLRQKYEEEMKLNEAKFELEKQLAEEKVTADKHRQQLILAGVCLILLTVLIFSFFIYKALNENKKKNKIISEQKLEVEIQKQLVEEKHKDITDSINYAQKIQNAIILSDKALQSKVKDIFVLFKPRDIVSGDFYWYSEKNNLKLLAVADCTGHGVPGAFMSMIGITMLNQIVNEKGITSPAEILNRLRTGVISSLNLTEEEAGKRDGMDVALIAWTDYSLVYAGANNPCLILRGNEFIELKADKQPVGLYEKQEPFKEQKMFLQKGDQVYLFTDGITDQFGGEKGKKVKMKGLKDWLVSLSEKSASEQRADLENKLNEWKGDIAQTDDILIIGFKS
jgi:serine phosphatase RsbU (regulator of sigma subunit)